MPMLQSIAQIPLETDESCRLAPLFQSILSSWITKCMRLIPAPPQDRVRPKLGCGSYSICGKIVEFLQNPERIKFVLTCAKTPIDHLRPLLTTEITEKSSLQVSILKVDAHYKLSIRKTFPGFPGFDDDYDQVRAELK